MNFKTNKKRFVMMQTLILLVSILKPMILATKIRSTNIQADHAVLILIWINNKLINRPWNCTTILAMPSHQLEQDLNLTPRQVKSAKGLLRHLGIITFYKTITDDGKTFGSLWALSTYYTRLTNVTIPVEKNRVQGGQEPSAESRQGKKIDPEIVRFKLVSKQNAKFSTTNGSDTYQYAKYRNVYARELAYAKDSLIGAKDTPLAVIINRLKKYNKPIDPFCHNFENVTFYEW